MEQTYQYPNLLTGTRSGEGWISSGHVPHDSGYIEDIGALYIQGTAAEEFFLFSPPVVLHKDTDYTLHCFAANTTNMSGTELFVLDVAGYSPSYYWIGNHSLLTAPGPGGGDGSMSHSGSIPIRGMAGLSGSASTTTAPRTARTASYGSATSCSPRARSRTHGHRQKGRCGLNER